jgi:hypothetical protein
MLQLLIAALMQSQSYHTDSSVCHVVTQSNSIVHQVCLTGQVATIEYTNGQVTESTDPELIEHLENI